MRFFETEKFVFQKKSYRKFSAQGVESKSVNIIFLLAPCQMVLKLYIIIVQIQEHQRIGMDKTCANIQSAEQEERSKRIAVKKQVTTNLSTLQNAKMQDMYWKQNMLLYSPEPIQSFEETLFPEVETVFMDQHLQVVRNAWEEYFYCQETNFYDQGQIKSQESLTQTLSILYNWQMQPELQKKIIQIMLAYQPDWLKIFNTFHLLFPIKFHEQVDFLIFNILKEYGEKSKPFPKPLTLENISLFVKNIAEYIIKISRAKLELLFFQQPYTKFKEQFTCFINIFVEMVCIAAAGFFVNNSCKYKIKWFLSEKFMRKKIKFRHRSTLEINQKPKKRRKI